MQVKDSDLKDEANETSPAGKHKGKSHKTDPGCNVNFFVLFNVLPWLVFSNTEARCYVEPEQPHLLSKDAMVSKEAPIVVRLPSYLVVEAITRVRLSCLYC